LHRAPNDYLTIVEGHYRSLVMSAGLSLLIPTLLLAANPVGQCSRPDGCGHVEGMGQGLVPCGPWRLDPDPCLRQFGRAAGAMRHVFLRESPATGVAALRHCHLRGDLRDVWG
jgi:hypothetical protein